MLPPPRGPDCHMCQTVARLAVSNVLLDPKRTIRPGFRLAPGSGAIWKLGDRSRQVVPVRDGQALIRLTTCSKTPRTSGNLHAKALGGDQKEPSTHDGFGRHIRLGIMRGGRNYVSKN